MPKIMPPADEFANGFTRTDFIELLDQIDAEYQVDDMPRPEGVSYDGIYIFDKLACKLKRNRPNKYKDLYIPYLRVSHFQEKNGVWYTKHNGVCRWMKFYEALNIIYDLTGRTKSNEGDDSAFN